MISVSHRPADSRNRVLEAPPPLQYPEIMFRIRRIYDDSVPRNQEAIRQIQGILRTQFPSLAQRHIDKIPEQLRNPLKYRFRPTLFVADDLRGNIRGFALLLYAPDLDFAYLDYISTTQKQVGRGVGSALYERVREEALHLKSVGLFFECLPDDPALSHDSEILKQNKARLRFYERYGARPIANTAYETPLKPGGDNPPYLVFDDLGQNAPLRRKQAQSIVRAILDRKYGDLCPAEYSEMVVASFQDDPVQLREPKYTHEEGSHRVSATIPADSRIVLVINDRQAIHHVRERGYVEAPVRIRVIRKELERTDLFNNVKPVHYSEKHIREVHDHHFVDYFKTVCAKVPATKSVYPYVFPIRNARRPPRDLSVRAGYYCIDTFTPLNLNAYLAAQRSVDCALTAADKVLEGFRLAYALVRPPGHHAERKAFGGFCYFNSSSIAANYLSQYGKVAVLDIDYHHGNGTQDIFWERSDVLTVSIHGHPRFAYPYFSGFEEEKGEGQGQGFNHNIPMPETVDGEHYRTALEKALRWVAHHKPKFLVLALGLDTAKGDPTGTFSLFAKDFETNGEMIGRLKLPTVVVQEGGYRTRVLGVNARRFLTGLWKGANEET